MDFLWILSLFLVKAETLKSDKIQNYVNIINGFNDYYNFNEILVISESEASETIKILINKIVRIPQITFNVVTLGSDLSSNYSCNHDRKLVLHIIDDFNVLEKLTTSHLQIFQKSRLKMIINIEAVMDPLSANFSSGYTDVVLTLNGCLYKYETYRRRLVPTTVSNFITNDSRNNPDVNFPILIRGLLIHEELVFPLTFKNGSGVVGYCICEFIKYLNKRLLKLGQDYNLTKIRHPINLYIEPAGKEIVEGGYPLMRYDDCFIFPILDEIPSANFWKQPFTKLTWFMILITLMFMAGLLRISVFNDLFISLFESLHITCGTVFKGTDIPRNRVIYLGLYLYGFIIYNMHMAKLSSYLTSPYLGKQIKTIEDVKENNVSLWATKVQKPYIFTYIQKEVLEYSMNELKGFLTPDVPSKIFYEHLHAFEAGRGYLVPSHRWRYMNHRQMLLKKKMFSLSDVCAGRGFVIPFKLFEYLPILQELFSYFTMKVLESGLDYIWELKTYHDIGLTYLKTYSMDWMILGYQYFTVAWWIFAVGISSSFIVFCIECVWILKMKN